MLRDPLLLLSALLSASLGSWVPRDPGRSLQEPANDAGAPQALQRSADAFVFAGHAAFRIDATPEVPAGLAKPLLREGVLEPGYFLVHFARPITGEDKTWLDALTAPVRRPDGSALARWYVPDDTLVAWVDSAAEWSALERSPRTDWVGRYEPAYKLDPALLDEPADTRLFLNADLVPGQASQPVVDALTGLGAQVLEDVHHRGNGAFDLHFLIVATEARLLPRLAAVEGIRLLQRRGEGEPHSDVGLPSELDGRWVAELARRARAGETLIGKLRGGQELLGTDEVAALLDLLAFDHPRMRVAVGAFEPLALAQSPLKNALVLENARLADLEPEGLTLESAALRKARWIDAQDGAPSGVPDAGRRSIAHDVAANEGFATPGEAARIHAFRCTSTDEPLRITLTWTDEPGSPGPGKQLVDDLDLVVTAPDGTLYRGNRFGASGESLSGGRSDSLLETERVLFAHPAVGLWTASVRPARGNFAAPQGYALLISGAALPVATAAISAASLTGPSGGRETLLVPTTLMLEASGGENSQSGSLGATALDRLRTSDDNRYTIDALTTLTLTFEGTLPVGTNVSAARVCIEHHEQPRIAAGDLLWTMDAGTAVLGNTQPTLHHGKSEEQLDVWSPSSTPAGASGLVVVIRNANPLNATVLDRAYVELDTVASNSSPHVSSIPNTTGVSGQHYDYDADDRAEAEGAAPLSWSVVSAPAGFSIQATTGLVSWTPATSGSFPITIRASNPSGSATQQFVVDVTAQAPLPPTVFPNNRSPLPYCPPERLAFGAAKPQQKLNVFLPPGTPPSSGWPVVVNNRAGGGIAAPALSSISDTGGTAPLHAFLSSGIAVVDFGVTGIGNGQGLFYPPGHASGRYESFRPADDNPEKDAEWAIQWIKTQSAYPLDIQSLILRGSSQGAILSAWVGMGPERAKAGGSPQVRAGTRVKGILALQPPVSIWAMDQTPAINSRMVGHYEQAAFPGVAATAFGQTAEQLQKDGSVMGFAFRTAAARAHNEEQPICLLFAEPVKKVGSVPVDMSLGSDGFPRLHDVIGQPYIHDSWSGYVFYKRLLDLSARSARFHADHSIFGVRDTTALAPPFQFHTQTFSGDVFGPAATAVAHQWVLRTLAATPATAGELQHAH